MKKGYAEMQQNQHLPAVVYNCFDATTIDKQGSQRFLADTIYNGYEANRPAKFISRQKLCLSATTDYSANDATGLPVMMVTGELTEKLQQAIEQNIIPELQKTTLFPSCLFLSGKVKHYGLMR